MKRMKCNLSQRFEVVLDSDLIDRVGEELSGIVKPGKVMIVADEAVAGLFGGRVKTSLEAAGFEASVFPFAQGENSKTLKTVEQLAAALSDGLFSKSDLIVGLGGGVAMDLAAMTAMLYYRGTRHAFIPTTLTAAIAAAIGGKIGIDGNGVKNLLGGFRQPVGVYVDTKVLSELKRSVFMQGMAEAVKYAFVGDKKLFARLVEGQFDLEDMVARCIRLKYEFVKGDEDETGKSLLLGFGNTFGNAVERLSDFTLSHGECVGIGMVISAKISENLFLQEGMAAALEQALTQYGLPVKCVYSAEEIYEAVLSDKKRAGDYIGLVLADRIGRAKLMRVETEKFRELIKLGIS